MVSHEYTSEPTQTVINATLFTESLSSHAFYLSIFLVIRKAASKDDNCIIRCSQKMLLHDG